MGVIKAKFDDIVEVSLYRGVPIYTRYGCFYKDQDDALEGAHAFDLYREVVKAIDNELDTDVKQGIVFHPEYHVYVSFQRLDQRTGAPILFSNKKPSANDVYPLPTKSESTKLNELQDAKRAAADAYRRYAQSLQMLYSPIYEARDEN